MTALSNSIKTLANDTLYTNSGNESIPLRSFVPQHYVTLEDLHKNHFNFSGKNGKLVKRKIRVKKLPAHLKGTRPGTHHRNCPFLFDLPLEIYFLKFIRKNVKGKKVRFYCNFNI